MGTRGAYGFIVDDKEKVTYNHMDSYPEFLGKNIISSFTRDTNIELLKSNVRKINMVSSDDIPDSDIDLFHACNKKTALEKRRMDTIHKKDWYSILREYQGNIEPYFCIDNPLLYMIDNKDFLYNSLFCEYAYIINLDTEMVEFYIGFNHDLNAPGRYSCPPNMLSKKNTNNLNTVGEYIGVISGYAGVFLVGEVPIGVLMKYSDKEKDDFIKKYSDFIRKLNNGKFSENEIQNLHFIEKLNN